MKPRHYALIAVGLAALAWWFRYDMQVSSGDFSRSYIIDRWTGRIYIVYPAGGIEAQDWPK